MYNDDTNYTELFVMRIKICRLFILSIFITGVLYGAEPLSFPLEDGAVKKYWLKFLVSPDGKSMAASWSVWAENKTEFYIQINQKRYGAYNSKIEKVYFSKKGNRYSFVIHDRQYYSQSCFFGSGKSESKYYVQTEKEKYGPFKKIFNIGYFGEDEKLLVSVSNEKNERKIILLDDTTNLEFLGFGYGYAWKKKFMSDDIKYTKPWYRYRDKGQTYLWIDGKTRGPLACETVPETVPEESGFPGESCKLKKKRSHCREIEWSGDGLNYWFAYGEKGKKYLRVNNKLHGPYERLGYKKLYNLSAKSIFYTFEEKGKHFIFSNNRVYGPYEDYYRLKTSREGSAFIFQYDEGDKKWVATNTGKFGPFDKVASTEIHKDGSAFLISYDIGKNSYIRLNNKVIGPYPRGTLHTTGDICSRGKQLVYYYHENEKLFIHTTHGVIGPVDKGMSPKIKYTSDGKHYAVSYKKNNKNFAVYDGVQYGPSKKSELELKTIESMQGDRKFPYLRIFDKILFRGMIMSTYRRGYGKKLKYVWHSEPQVTFDRTKMGFKVCLDGGEHDRYKLAVINGVTMGPYEYLSNLHLSFLGNSIGFYYTDLKKKKYAWVNGKTYGPIRMDRVSAGYLEFNRSGSRFAICYMTGKKNYIIHDAGNEGPFENVDKLFFSKASRLCFFYKKQGKKYLWADGKTYGPYDTWAQFVRSGSSEFAVYESRGAMKAVPIISL
ncbi:MAG: hypothetical protein GY754_22520 [bacterium]|nr:hypothetical protein [bacterium]